MEAISRILIVLTTLAFLSACSTRSIMKEEEGQFEDIEQEYEKVVKIETMTPPPTPTPTPTPVPPLEKKQAKPKKKVAVPKKAIKPNHKKISRKKVKKHYPEIEGQDGFDGRRPTPDPFRPGEEMVIEVSYLGMTAGEFTLSTKPFKLVNDQQSYHFVASVLSNTSFSLFYSVQNLAETFVDYNTLRPYTLTYDNRESAQIVKSKTFFDWKKKEATMWEKRVSKKKGDKKKNINWKIKDFSQNSISALFYLRAFKLEPGKKFAFRVADDGKNVVFKGEVLRREKIEVEAGEFDALVVKPTFTVDGHLKQSGENLVWLSDDDRKFILKIKSKVKIGSLKGELVRLNKGL